MKYGNERKPTHLLAKGQEVTLCGIKYNDDRRYPLVQIDFLPVHHQGHGAWPCDACAAVLARALLAAAGQGPTLGAISRRGRP